MRMYRLMLLAVLLGFGPVAADSYSNSWRVEFSEGAKSDGTIEFEISPEGSPAFQVSIPVSDGTRENAVARTVAKKLEDELDDTLFSIEVDDGEDVLVKKKHGAPDFGLRLVSNTVKAVRIDVEKE